MSWCGDVLVSMEAVVCLSDVMRFLPLLVSAMKAQDHGYDAYDCEQAIQDGDAHVWFRE